MDLGAILLPASTAERHPAASADTAPRTTVRTPTLPAHGANIAIHSIGVQKLVPAAARPLLTMRIIAILMAHGQKRTIRSTNARKPARFVRLPVKNTPTMWIPTATANVTTAAQRSA